MVDSTETVRDAYVAGYRQALADATRCGAVNDPQPPPRYAACIKPMDHAGMHDDGWCLWGDREASVESNQRDAARARGEAPLFSAG